ncbi:MAG: hypothetical protein ABGW49_01795 [Nitrosopumilus sp.]|jgi:hypothetical protein
MKARRILLSIGTMITILGVVFHLQGQSIVGPKSSFMYSNPDWVTHGIQIIVVGIIIIGVGFGTRLIKKE